jgi:hypothetical protein
MDNDFVFLNAMIRGVLMGKNSGDLGGFKGVTGCGWLDLPLGA